QCRQSQPRRDSVALVAFSRGTAMNESFSARLKSSTATIHDEVEHTTFMVDLMEGRLDARAYALLLRQYNVIYPVRSEEHTSELQSRFDLVCRLLLEKKKRILK